MVAAAWHRDQQVILAVAPPSFPLTTLRRLHTVNSAPSGGSVTTAGPMASSWERRSGRRHHLSLPLSSGARCGRVWPFHLVRPVAVAFTASASTRVTQSMTRHECVNRTPEISAILIVLLKNPAAYIEFIITSIYLESRLDLSIAH